jgi:hypothetical protein
MIFVPVSGKHVDNFHSDSTSSRSQVNGALLWMNKQSLFNQFNNNLTSSYWYVQSDAVYDKYTYVNHPETGFLQTCTQ